jgi:hypothetical protein
LLEVIASEAKQSVPVRHLKGEALSGKIILPAEIIDKTNYKAWLVPGTSAAARIGAKSSGEGSGLPNESKSQLNVLTAEIAETAALRDAGPSDIRRLI